MNMCESVGSQLIMGALFATVFVPLGIIIIVFVLGIIRAALR